MAEAVGCPMVELKEFPYEAKYAYYVVGGEGMGTHMLRDSLVKAGCSWKQEHESYQENYHFEEMPSPFVFRRSLPHAYSWPNLKRNVVDLRESGFYVRMLFILRDFFAAAQSVINRNYQGSIEDCYHNQRAMFALFDDELLSHVEFVPITYEQFCLCDGFRKRLFEERLRLPYPEDFQIWYANDQYYG